MEIGIVIAVVFIGVVLYFLNKKDAPSDSAAIPPGTPTPKPTRPSKFPLPGQEER